jgi:hypothetical protein
MKRILIGLATAGIAVLVVSVEAAQAGDRKVRSRTVEQGPQLNEHPNSRYYRGTGPQVRGYVARRGGYSYSYNDSIIDYRDTSIHRDHRSWRGQAAPFDSDFFFDSGILRNNSSPYHN